MSQLPSRRSLLRASAVLGAGAASAVALPSASTASPVLLRAGRGQLTHGVAAGDVTARTAVLWARADRPGRLVATVRLPGRGGGLRHVRGPVVDRSGDLAGRIRLSGLRPGETYEYSLAVDSGHGPGQPVDGTFSTAPRSRRDVSFVWTGDTAGQGWGRHVDDGMPGYSAMLATRPDFLVHSGDTVYSDGPISESVALPDGSMWRNVVSDGVGKVAETLDEFRGRHRYNLADRHVRALNASVPVYAQWDDHEVVNNWYPGEVLSDPRYTHEQRVDVLAQRARRAFTDYFPLDRRRHDAEGKVYGRFSRGPHLDLFMLDMRTYRGANSANLQPAAGPDTRFLGAEQADWLVDGLSRSRATWKAVMADMPLGVVIPDGSLQEGVSNADPGPPLGRELEIASVLRRIKRAGVCNVVWFTADVHYCAAHHYDPARAAFTDFRPFWEFVGGPIHAGSFGPSALDGTFGPEAVFSEVADFPNQPPSGGKQFFGHVAIEGRSGAMTVRLVNTQGVTRFEQVLEPE